MELARAKIYQIGAFITKANKTRLITIARRTLRISIRKRHAPRTYYTSRKQHPMPPHRH